MWNVNSGPIAAAQLLNLVTGTFRQQRAKRRINEVLKVRQLPPLHGCTYRVLLRSQISSVHTCFQNVVLRSHRPNIEKRWLLSHVKIW